MAEQAFPYDSPYSAESHYRNFEDFLVRSSSFIRTDCIEYVGIYAYIRLTKDDLEKGRRIFSWAVKRVFLRYMSQYLYRGKISEEGQSWLQKAESQLGRDPVRSLKIVEAVFVLECLAFWAERELPRRLPGQTVREFRGVSHDNLNKTLHAEMVDMVYQTARLKAIEYCRQFVMARDAALMLGIAAFAAECRTLPTDDEINAAITQQMPTHPSLAKQREFKFLRGPIVHEHDLVPWVLGRDPEEFKEIPF